MLSLESGTLEGLVARLKGHQLDVVLAWRPCPPPTPTTPALPPGGQPIGLAGGPHRAQAGPADLLPFVQAHTGPEPWPVRAFGAQETPAC
jgi:hypothetical protein